jgi:hypothetical protein
MWRFKKNNTYQEKGKLSHDLPLVTQLNFKLKIVLRESQFQIRSWRGINLVKKILVTACTRSSFY